MFLRLSGNYYVAVGSSLRVKCAPHDCSRQNTMGATFADIYHDDIYSWLEATIRVTETIYGIFNAHVFFLWRFPGENYINIKYNTNVLACIFITQGTQILYDVSSTFVS